jgi:hypothetical protein
MKKVQEYHIVETPSRQSLVEMVNTYLQNDWQLLGGPTMVINQYTWVGTFYQAITREVDQPGPWD